MSSFRKSAGRQEPLKRARDGDDAQPSSSSARQRQAPAVEVDFSCPALARVKGHPTAIRITLNAGDKELIQDHFYAASNSTKEAAMTGLKDRAKRASICLSLKPDAQDWHKVARPIKEETEREILEAFIGACSHEQIFIESRILGSNAPKVIILCLSVVSAQLSDEEFCKTTPLNDWYLRSRRRIPTLVNRQYDGLPRDLCRCWLSIAPETCRQMGWPDVAACLADVAATPNYHAPNIDAYPGYIVRFCTRKELERDAKGMGKQWTTVARDQTLVEELLDSHGVKELVFSQLTAGAGDDVQTVIEQRNIDASFSSIRPSASKVGASYWVGMRDGPVLLQGLSTPSRARADMWIEQLEQVIIRFDRERGREFTSSEAGKKAVALERIAGIFGVALDSDAAAFLTRDDIRAEANADRTSPTAACLGVPDPHPLTLRFPREELFATFFCFYHFMWYLVRQLDKVKQKAYSYKMHVMSYDKPRGVEVDLSIIDSISSLHRLEVGVLPTSDLLKARKLLGDLLEARKGGVDAITAEQVSACLGGIVRASCLSVSPPGAEPMPVLEAAKILLSKHESMDFWRQCADWAGGDRRPTGHNDQSCVATTAWWNRRRKSGLPLMTSVWLVAVCTNAVVPPPPLSITAVEKLMAGAKPVHAAYSGEVRRDESTPRLSPAVCDLAEEAHRLALGSPLPSAPRLFAAVAAVTPSAPDLAGFKSTYPTKAHVPEKNKKYFERFSNDGLEQMLDNGYAALMALDDEQVAKWSKRFYDIAVLFANDQPLHTTPQGLPSLWFPHDSAIDIMELAQVVSMGGFIFCDDAHVDIWADVDDDQRLVPWVKTMIVFIEHFFTHGHREAPTRLTIDFSDDSDFSPRKGSMLAKRRHGLAFFSAAVLNVDILAGGFVMETWRAGNNATVQTQITNFMFRNYRGSVLATIAYDSRPMAARRAHSFAALGLLEGYDADTVEPVAANLEAANPSFREEVLQEIRGNLVEEWEV